MSGLARRYRALALFTFNGILIFVAGNIVLAPFFPSPAQEAMGLTPRKRDPRDFQKAYPDRKPEEIAAILEETWSRPLAFAPYVEFRESPFAGRYVNVSPAGFRASAEQGPWPPEPKGTSVFVFGGSTTFGYGVPDDETVASYLQTELRRMDPSIAVYNFGCGYYFSTQERILFESLLADGRVPAIAIFIDGLNEFYFGQDPMFADRLRESSRAQTSPWVMAVRALPAARALSLCKQKLMPAPKPPRRNGRQQQWIAFGGEASTPKPSVPGSCPDPGRVEMAIARYLANKQLIEAAASSRNVGVLFDWQPVPVYHYDRSHHPVSTNFGRHECAAAGYPLAEERLAKGELGDDFLWSADIQGDLWEPLYVDTVHYSKTLARALAVHVATAVHDRALLREGP